MKTVLDYVDYIIFGAVLLMSALIGVIFSVVGGGQKTTDEFLMAGRNMGVIPVTLSLLVSYQSAIMILGKANEVVYYGAGIFIITLSSILAIFISAALFVPLFKRIQVVSTFEYLEMRYHSKSVRFFAGFIGTISSIMYMGVASYAPSVAVNAVSGFPVWGSILIVTGVSTFYTTLGGMKAVLWTDVFQFLVMMVGIAGILIKGLMVTGGMANVWQTMNDEKRLQFFDLDPNPTTRHTLWGFLFGGTLMWTMVYGMNQASVQRYNTLSTLRRARTSLLLNIPCALVLSVPVILTGMVICTYYTQKMCDPFQAKYISNRNQILPWFVMEVFEDNPGFAGLFLATLFSGALSSNSSTLSGFTAVLWEDYLKFYFSFTNKKISERAATLISKIVVVIFGIAGTGVALLCQFIDGPITQVGLSFAGATSGPLLGMYFLALFTTYTNWIGALSGGICATVVVFWIIMGGKSNKICSYNPPLPSISIQGCSNNNTRFMGNMSTLTDVPVVLVTPNSTYVSGNMSDEICKGCCQYGPTYEGMDNLYAISYLWYPVIGMVITIIIGLIVSAFSGPMTKDDIDPELLVPFLAKYLYGDRINKRKQQLAERLEAYTNVDPKITDNNEVMTLMLYQDPNI